MSMYTDVEAYAKETQITVAQAKIRCSYFLKLEKKIYEAKKCPKCGQHELEIEMGSYEEGTRDCVFCNHCDFLSEVKKSFKPLGFGYDFDEVLWFAYQSKCDGIEKTERQLGYSWHEFVEKSNQNLILEEKNDEN